VTEDIEKRVPSSGSGEGWQAAVYTISIVYIRLYLLFWQGVRILGHLGKSCSCCATRKYASTIQKHPHPHTTTSTLPRFFELTISIWYHIFYAPTNMLIVILWTHFTILGGQKHILVTLLWIGMVAQQPMNQLIIEFLHKKKYLIYLVAG
jgi:hypothetical protein